jgi:hypothetical protein
MPGLVGRRGLMYEYSSLISGYGYDAENHIMMMNFTNLLGLGLKVRPSP